ncbi:MAG: thioredoxin family protein [Phycisphaerae bacterium]|nr:thioredoxin family protein [Saprospiraceae bacterium]
MIRIAPIARPTANRQLPLLLPLLLLLPSAAPAQGIQFEHTTWSETLTKAKSEGKLVFLDAVTTWCGPCKMMSKEVFPDTAVGTFFNAHFVNIKLDMEHGEGIEISSRYQIWVYPTLLFVDSTGEVQHRSAGFHNPQELIALGNTALDPTRNLAALEHQYASGNRRREFLLKYLEAKTLAFDPDAGQIANDFLKTEDNLGTPENMDLLMRHIDDPYSEGFQFLLKNRPVFEEKYGKREVKAKIESVFEDYLQSHPELQLGEVQRLYGTVYPEGGEAMASRYRLEYYYQKNDRENFARTAIEHYTRYPSDDPDELNEMAAIFAEEVSDPARLQTALDWVEKAISIQETSYYQYTLAKVWLKIGKKKAARKAAVRSLKLAEIEGEDTMLVEELLDSLK